jgi:hypothetical protein
MKDNIIEKINRILEKETGATVAANVEKNPAAETNMVRRQNQYKCPDGQKWCPVRKQCIPDPMSEGMESDIELVRMVAKDFGVEDEISDSQAKKIVKMVKQRGSKEDFYYNLKEYFLN